MKCDNCNAREVKTLPYYIYGETFQYCEDCFQKKRVEQELEKGMVKK